MKHTITILIAFGLTMGPAMAATFVQNGNNVKAIDNIVILGSTYDVTFGEAVDTTFGSSALAISAADALRLALDADSPTAITVGPSDLHFIVCASSPAAGSCDGEISSSIPGGWVDGGSQTGWSVNVDNPVADFTLVGVPEPGALTMAVPGLALLLFLVARRRAARSAQLRLQRFEAAL